MTFSIVVDKIRAGISDKAIRSLAKLMGPDGDQFGNKRTVTADGVQAGAAAGGVSISAEEAALVAGDYNQLL